MALINCPECNREISDRVKACPHCGYPIGDDETDKTINSNKKKSKGIILISILFLMIIGVSVVGIKLRNDKIEAERIEKERIEIEQQAKLKAKQDAIEYVQNIIETNDLMVERATDCSFIFDIVYTVWNKSITTQARNDFSINLSYLYSGEQYKDIDNWYNGGYDIYWFAEIDNGQVETFRKKVKDVIENESIIAEKISELKEHPEQYKTLYDETLKLYEIYQGMSNQAQNPSGSLLTYSSDVNEKVDSFTTQYKKIQTLLP